MALADHLRDYWTNHMAAMSGTVFSLLNGATIENGIAVGVGIFLITSGLKWIWTKITKH